MKVEVRYGPAYALALVNLEANETIQVEEWRKLTMAKTME